jgi:hypothetical protein
MGEAQTAEGKGGLRHEAAPVEEAAAEGGELFWSHGLTRSSVLRHRREIR